MVKRLVPTLLAILSPLFASAPASASVIYDLQGSSGIATYAFVYTAPDFITAPLTVPGADFDSCELTVLTTDACSSVEFGLSHLTIATLISSVTFGFPSEVLGFPNTTTSASFTLIVTQQPDTPVPEPTSVALLSLGLAGIVVLRWRPLKTRRC